MAITLNQNIPSEHFILYKKAITQGIMPRSWIFFPVTYTTRVFKIDGEFLEGTGIIRKHRPLGSTLGRY